MHDNYVNILDNSVYMQDIMLTCKLLIFLDDLILNETNDLLKLDSEIINARCNIIMITCNLFMLICEKSI